MRFVSGDECGVVKEFCIQIPSRSATNNDAYTNESVKASLPPNNKFNKNAVPVITDYSTPKDTNSSSTVLRRLGSCAGSADAAAGTVDLSIEMDRRYGVIDMTWIDNDDAANNDNNNNSHSTMPHKTRQFATLSINGTIQIWQKEQQRNDSNNSNNKTSNATPNNQENKEISDKGYERIWQIDDVFGVLIQEKDNEDDERPNDIRNSHDDDDITDTTQTNAIITHAKSNSKRRKLNDDASESGGDSNDQSDDDDDNNISDDDDDGSNVSSSSTSSSYQRAPLVPALDPLTHGLSISYWNEKKKLIACNAHGKVIAIDVPAFVWNGGSSTDDDNSEDSNSSNPIETVLYIYGKDAKNVYDEVKHQQKHASQIVSAFALHRHYIAAGGRDRETVVYDLLNLNNNNNNGVKPIWKAKNLPPNPQTLLQPLIWPTAIQFLQNYDKSNTDDDKSEESLLRLAVGTAYKQIRIYEIEVPSKKDASNQLQQQRRPIQYTPEGNPIEYRVTSICQNPLQPRQLIIGDAAGYVYSIDLSSLPRGKTIASKMQTTHCHIKLHVTRYVGPAGSVRCIYAHPKQPIIALVGLDRMLRVYHTVHKKQLYCIYLKQRLNTVIIEMEDIIDNDIMKQYIKKNYRNTIDDDDDEYNGSRRSKQYNDDAGNDSDDMKHDDDIVEDYVMNSSDEGEDSEADFDDDDE